MLWQRNSIRLRIFLYFYLP